jgi:tetratricopeptide (TPR) repeat protein
LPINNNRDKTRSAQPKKLNLHKKLVKICGTSLQHVEVMKLIHMSVALIALTGACEFSTAKLAFSYTPQPNLLQPLVWSQVRLALANANLFEEGLKKQAQEDYTGAIADYTEFLKTHPDHLEGYSNRGFAKAMLNNLQGAIQDFDRAIALSPRNADAYNARGNVNAMAGNLTASIRDFNQSIRCDRNFADAYYNRAISRHGLGDRRGAKSDLRQAARLFQKQQDPGGYQQAREWIDKLK